MLRKGRRVFELKDSVIQQILMCDNSDDESDLLLVEEDQRILTQDDDQGVFAVEIEDAAVDLQDTFLWRYEAILANFLILNHSAKSELQIKIKATME